MSRYLRKLLGVKSPSEEMARPLTASDHFEMAKAAIEAGIEPLPEEWPSFTLPEYKAPPVGWYTYGTHIDWDIPMEFSEDTDDAGLPLWERPRLVTDEKSPMTGDELDRAALAVGTVIVDHWQDHDGGPSSADDSCDEFCTARHVLVWLEREAERQEDAGQ